MIPTDRTNEKERGSALWGFAPGRVLLGGECVSFVCTYVMCTLLDALADGEMGRIEWGYGEWVEVVICELECVVRQERVGKRGSKRRRKKRTTTTVSNYLDLHLNRHKRAIASRMIPTRWICLQLFARTAGYYTSGLISSIMSCTIKHDLVSVLPSHACSFCFILPH